MATKKSARRTRRTHTPAFKAQVALAALREDKMAGVNYLGRSATTILSGLRRGSCRR